MISRGLAQLNRTGSGPTCASFAEKVQTMNSNNSPRSVEHSLLTAGDDHDVNRHVMSVRLEPGS